MDNQDLIGRVAAAYLNDRTTDADPTTVARYLLDSLSDEQTAAVAHAVLAHPVLAPKIEMKLPRQRLARFGLPAECLTDERATYFRNAPCERPALLIATPGDDERQSLSDLTVIDTPLLRDQVDLWVKVASAELPITDQQRRIWAAALHGLKDVASVTLGCFAQFVLNIRLGVEDGRPFPDVIGYAMPTLQWPRNPAMFRSLNDKTRFHNSKWKQLFQQVQKKQACYLRKHTPNNQVLSADDLTAAFRNVRDSIPEEFHGTINAFIASPAKWNAEAEALAQIDWESIKPLFDGLRPERFNLGGATLQYFNEQEEDRLSQDERTYLEGLARRNSSESIPDDLAFYREHRQDLKNEPHLKSKWDRFVFGTPIETGDFLSGLALCLESLFDQNLMAGSKRQLHISCDKRSKADLRKLNVDAALYFAFRYRGLRDLLGGEIFDVRYLLDFEATHEQWIAEGKEGRKKYKPNDSNARAALEIKFYIDLTVDDGRIDNHRQLIWRFDPAAVASELYADWQRLQEHPFIVCEVARESVGPKGQAQPLDLRQARSLAAAYGQDRGTLVSVYRRDQDIELLWRRNLQTASEQGWVTSALAAELAARFDEFATQYRAAIEAFAKVSVAAAETVGQYEAYGRLVDAVTQKAKGDRLRELLLKPLLAIGVVQVGGGAPAAIVAPWNPLRLQAMALKAQRLVDLIRRLLRKDEPVLFGDAALYFKEMQDELTHPYYPEVALGWTERKPELLSLSDSSMDYSLHELPLRSDGADSETNENPTVAATQIVEMLQRYLMLFPHERANLSAVLYNCDSASLPQAVVDRINELHEDDEDMRCEVVLRHRDRDKLHRLYERILEGSDSDNDGFVASEASRDFMARLRIGIMAEEAVVPDLKDGPSKDVAFLHDVISRHAVLEWYREDATPVATRELVPARWSRRRPSPRDEEKSIVYLCCPVQTEVGWSYMTAISSFFRPDWDADGSRRYLPARQLNFHDPITARIFEETHNLANWVVNFDELLDRRQLVNQGVRVIRYKQSATQGRNLLVSSNTSLGLLQSMLLSRIRDLVPELPDARLQNAARRFIDDANQISGDLVLRAAKRGRNASELMGVVLSHYLVRNEVGPQHRLGCYFLDDYSDWLGESGERIADLLMLAPEIGPDGSPRLAVIVTEAKYVTEETVTEKRKESQRQLRDSVLRIEEALFGDPPRLDRDLWLARFSDLLLSGIPYSAGEAIDLIRLRRQVREGRCPIYVRGYSHVFVSGPAGGTECSDFAPVSDCDGSFQECFSRDKTRALVMAYESGTAPGPVRYTVADLRVLDQRVYRDVPAATLPCARVDTTRSARATRAQQPTMPVSVQAPIDGPSAVPVLPGPSVVSGQAPLEVGTMPSDAGAWADPHIAAIVAGRRGPQAATEAETEWLRATVTATRTALQQFQLDSKLSGDPILTPNAAIIRFQGSKNMTVDLLARKRSEFLTTFGLDVIAIRGEAGAVSVSIARPQRQVLHTLDVWTRWNPECLHGNHKLLVGVKEDDSGLLFISPTENAPHTLIAGATGSGKSVLMQNIILAIACTNTPDQARIDLIDPKMGVDYFAFEGLPHLGSGVIEEQERAIERLNGLLIEMDRRYAVLRKNRCSNIFELNRKEGATERLPCLWVIHDEFAEWMMIDEYNETVSNVVSRLGVKARAAGIFLIFAAQRPDNQVMPMQLRSNLGNRLILRVDSEGTSEIALGGERGAERLLGRGHMVAKLEGYPGLVYAQVPMLTAGEIAQLVGVIRQQHDSSTREYPDGI